MRQGRLELRASRHVTGRMVLTAIVAFFAVIFAVNLTMAMFAISTFGGVESRNAYQAGLVFSQEIAAARAQEARNWRVNARISPWAPDGITAEFAVKDAAGRSVSGAEISVTFAHPANRREDHVVVLNEIGAGAYRGRTEVPRGQWDLIVEAERNGERVFRSKNRIQIH